MTEKSTIVIGAGVIGSATALELAEDGQNVTLVERSEPGHGASFGNASLLGTTECVPMAAPGVLRNVPRWLFAREGPLFLPPAYLPFALPWLLRFALHTTRARTEANSEALAALLSSAKSDTLAWLERVGLPSHLSETETLRLYTTRAHLDADQYKLDLRRRHGASYRCLTSAEIADLEPSISGDYEAGLLARDAHYFLNPVEPIFRTVDLFCGLGGKLITGAVSRLDMSGPKPSVMLENGNSITADKVVVAAGIHSGRLAETVGDRFPLESERGYHVQFAGADFGLSRGVVDTVRGFAAAPIMGGLRVAGLVEFGGLNPRPNALCIRILKQNAGIMFGDSLGSEGPVTTWFGHRPSLPDGLPVIGPSRRHRDLLYCFGHGHLGLTLAATSARLVRELLGEAEPPPEVRCVSPHRF